jgi:hypothetical protein
MPRRGDAVDISLPFDKALANLLKVNPTADMMRPEAHPTKGKWKRAKKGIQSP